MKKITKKYLVGITIIMGVIYIDFKFKMRLIETTWQLITSSIISVMVIIYLISVYLDKKYNQIDENDKYDKNKELDEWRACDFDNRNQFIPWAISTINEERRQRRDAELFYLFIIVILLVTMIFR